MDVLISVLMIHIYIYNIYIFNIHNTHNMIAAIHVIPYLFDEKYSFSK